LAQVTLTERHRAPSVLFCTGHAAGDEPVPVDSWAALLHGGTTLVLYMGMSALARIAPPLCAALSGEAIHVTAVSQVSGENQRQVTAPLQDIEARLAADPLPQPVVFLLGRHAVPFDGLADWAVAASEHDHAT
jgi:siroheme synthase